MNTNYKLDDSVIANIAKLIQIAILTGTDIVDNLRTLSLNIDPTGEKFKEFYPDDVHLISSFFPTDKLFEIFPNKRAKIITSISMFYDLEDPLSFVEAITQTLHRNGIWHLEQSYLPTMLEKKSYDI